MKRVEAAGVTRSRSSSRFETFRRKVFGGASEEERQGCGGASPGTTRKDPATDASKRRSVFGLSGTHRKSKGDDDEGDGGGVQFAESSNSSSPPPALAASTPVIPPVAAALEGSPAATRTRRSLSVANLKEKLVAKTEYRKSVGESKPVTAAAPGASSSSSSGAPAGAEAAADKEGPRLRRQISEKFSRSAVAKTPVTETAGVQRTRAGSFTPELARTSATPAAPEEPAAPRFLARPAASIPEREALLSALSSCVVNLTRLLGSSNKAARMLGQEPRTRSSSVVEPGAVGTLLASQQPTDGGAVLEAAAQLGEAIANLTSRLYEPGSAALVRETLAKVKRLEDAASHLFERAEDGREWKEVYRRMGNSVLKLLSALEAHVRDPESPVLLLRVRGVLDELQGAGYYLKAFLSGVLIEASAEQALLCCSNSLFQLGNAAVAKLVAAGVGSAAPVRRLAEILSELRLSVIVLSPVACCKEPGAQLASWCGDCAAAVDAVLAEVPEAGKIASLQRTKQLAIQARALVRTAVSAVRVRIQANAGNVVALLALAEAATAALQRSNVRLTELRPVLSQLSAACDAVRGGLLSGSRVQSSAWAEVHAHQKRVLADAMLCERSARPLLSDDAAAPGAAREDVQDAMLVSAIRLSCNIKSFVSLYIASAAGNDADSLTAACELVAAGNARHRSRALLAASWGALATAETQLRNVSQPEEQRFLFGAISKAGAACHEVVLALDELEGMREAGAEPAAWQQLSPVAQLAQLPQIWNGPNARLIEAAKELAAAVAAESLPVEVIEALHPHCSNLKTALDGCCK